MAEHTYRVPVLFGQAGNGKSKREKTVVLVLERIAKKLELQIAKPEDLIASKKGGGEGKIHLKGDRDNSVKIFTGETTDKGSKKTLSVPYPAGATIAQIAEFVKKIKSAKTFTMPSGQTYFVGEIK